MARAFFCPFFDFRCVSDPPDQMETGADLANTYCHGVLLSGPDGEARRTASGRCTRGRRW
ncbi:hypothetical protein SAMN04488540_11334 [Ferrimonas sediminum]|uniref:Uncharacterized protein n=1 Tax=Ferrimonas sediminum TaxID=718193 RepID=A0A1G8WDW4_9GAMM|nr:hypothetical protein SAMN04488540_11334 [Ferrimonas sediminum]